ncbi:MAG: YqiJ family protein [Halobacteriovoraceae bacterium]|nr:YqiJ family protein [Halobacteriovoraceae bacterium]
MSFREFYMLGVNLPFTVSIAVVSILSLLEGVAFLLGFGLISFLDSFLPDVSLELDGPELEELGFVSKTLSFLKVKNVPLVILFVCFLMSFGVSGLFIQGCFYSITKTTLNPLLIIPIALLIGLSLMKGFGTVIARIFPDDETDARALDTFVSKVAVVTLGTVKNNHPAQCKVKDHIGAYHYFMVLPDNEEEQIHQGENILLVRYDHPYFYGIKPNKNIIPGD